MGGAVVPTDNRQPRASEEVLRRVSLLGTDRPLRPSAVGEREILPTEVEVKPTSCFLPAQRKVPEDLALIRTS